MPPVSFRRLIAPSLGFDLSNIMACPSSAEPDTHRTGLDEFRRLGGNCLHLHGEGGETHSRRATGEWLRQHKLRPHFFLCSQICQEGWDASRRKPVDRFMAEAVANDITADLDSLGTNYLDLVYAQDNPSAPVEPVIEQLARDMAQGRVRAYGVRNWSASRIKQANAHAARIGAPGIAAVITTELSLLVAASPLWPDDIPFTKIEPAVIDLSLVVLAHADGSNQGQQLFDAADSIHPARPAGRWNHPANAPIVARIRELAEGHKVAPMELALAWLLNRPFKTVALLSLPSLLAANSIQFERASQLLFEDALLSSLRHV
jgi:aryl-alcohol dehydrogenase-like predicted oxidoreductase